MGAEEVIAAYVEVCVGLMVCNIPIVVTKLIKDWGDQSEHTHSQRTISIRSSKWMSLKFASRSKARGTEDTESSGVANGSHAVKTATTGEISGAGWLRWERELPEEDTSSLHSRSRDTCPVPCPVTIDLSHVAPEHEEIDTRSEHRYPPPPPSTKKSIATWS